MLSTVWNPQRGSQSSIEKRRGRKEIEVSWRRKGGIKRRRSLPEKDFRIMIIKMIKNLENKMELQINSLETRIKKMQEMFNKDLEGIKKSQYIMNNTINEIKSILEGTNSRIMEAEDRISEVEDRMVEINESERKKEKRIKRKEDNLSDLQDNIKCYNIRIIGVPEEEDKKKDHEKNT